MQAHHLHRASTCRQHPYPRWPTPSPPHAAPSNKRCRSPLTWIRVPLRNCTSRTPKAYGRPSMMPVSKPSMILRPCRLVLLVQREFAGTNESMTRTQPSGTRHQPPNTSHPIPAIRHQTPDTRHQTTDTRQQTTDNRQHQNERSGLIVLPGHAHPDQEFFLLPFVLNIHYHIHPAPTNRHKPSGSSPDNARKPGFVRHHRPA